MNDYLHDEESFTSQKVDWNVWKKILKFMKPLTKYAVFGVIAMIALAATDVVYPLISAFAIDDIINPNILNDGTDLSKLTLFIGLYIGFMIVQAISVFLFIKFAGKIQTELAYSIRKKAFHHLQELPFSYYDRTRVGWIMARMTSDSRNLSELFSWGLIDLTWGFSLMVILTIVMFVINWKLALVVIAIVPFMAGVSIFFRKYILKAYRQIRKVNSKITGAYNEGITGAMTTKTLVLEDNNFEDFDDLTTDMRTRSIRAAMIQGLYFPTMLFLITLGVALVYIVGGNLVL